MPKRKLTGAGKKDYRVTVRLDPETYRSLSEAVEQGAISNLSEALRSMIRQKLWEQRFSNEMQLDLKWNEVSRKELRSSEQDVRRPRCFGVQKIPDGRWLYRGYLLSGGRGCEERAR